MSYEQIDYRIDDRVAVITLNRPDRLNAWTDVMEREVREAMETAAADDDAYVIVLTGAGRGFCAGADMELLSAATEGAEAGAPTTRPFDVYTRPDYQAQYSYFPSIPKPILGAINGPVAGLGLVLSLYCDVRLAGSEATFTTAFGRRGLIAEHGISWMLPRLVGHAHALDLLLSARKLDAAEAERIGLVNRVIPQDQFMESVMSYARDLAYNVSPRSMRVMKRQVYEAFFQTLAEAIGVANREMIDSLASEDFKEGVAHFVEKRQARFPGR